MTKLGGGVMMLIVGFWFWGLLVPVIHSNRENQLAAVVLSVPIAFVALLVYGIDKLWRVHRAREEQKPGLRDLSGLVRHDPPS